MDGTISDREQHMMKSKIMHRQPVQLSESGGDVIQYELFYKNKQAILSTKRTDTVSFPEKFIQTKASRETSCQTNVNERSNLVIPYLTFSCQTNMNE